MTGQSVRYLARVKIPQISHAAPVGCDQVLAIRAKGNTPNDVIVFTGKILYDFAGVGIPHRHRCGPGCCRHILARGIEGDRKYIRNSIKRIFNKNLKRTKRLLRIGVPDFCGTIAASCG